MERIVSWVANLIQIGSVVFAVVSLLLARRELTRYLRRRKTELSERPWALIIGLGSDITGQVEGFLKDQKPNMPVESYVRDGMVSTEDLYPLLKDLLRIKGKLTQAGVTEVHLFYKGPVTMAMAIGAITDNWVPIKVYEYTKGTYQLTCVLEKETVKGLLAGDVMDVGKSVLTQS
ncbi:MAG: SAVED domain-containing protein [Anaerolineae bacterium]|nr:SAVED domain-containing protein [Anaerolineae bacterium]